ncbi:Indoleamine 2,3-dioxygenase [Lentinula edodes]|uniref:Indoleamine 2,3-dioxygenase n=1 Tax=Lentinula lateritia TaxID=40482 RepID=A0A9W9AR55_9AGAR|nr:Indoleamine 2,3-dioxygenase [Lentinula edodes]
MPTTSTMDASTPPLDSFTDDNTPTTSSMNSTNTLFPLPPSHFLSQPRPSGIASPSSSNNVGVDTTTLAAHDFDVDPRTGFMPPHPPIARLGGVGGVGGENGENGEYGKYGMYEAWEGILDEACAGAFRLGRDIGTETGGKEERWRGRVRELPILSITPLLDSEPHLRRAHHVLAWILHFYIHTHQSGSGSEEEEVRIPPPITLPLLRVSREMHLPPLLTYSDDVLYNWAFTDPQNSESLRVLTSFTSTPDESHFYLTSARIELIGVRALGLMQYSLDELFVGDGIARKRITGFLGELAGVIGEMEGELGRMYGGCDVGVFYEEIRPWFQGESEEKRWVFEGIEGDPELEYPKELGGPSAGQSSLIHALDIFLGVEHQHHTSDTDPDSSFLSRMQLYMPRHHRNFLSHLREQSRRRSLRAWVLESQHDYNDSANPVPDTPLLNAYNSAVTALKKFRDAHIVLVARYIIGPAARARANEGQSQSDDSNRECQSDGKECESESEGKSNSNSKESNAEGERESETQVLKGTGGTHLARFLKSVRDNTRDAVIQ